MRKASRRDFLSTTLQSLAAVPLVRSFDLSAATQSRSMFRHGVASGDPLSDRVILWTRVTTSEALAVDVAWKMATDPGLLKVVARGQGRTGAARDFTVKVDVTGLSPSTTYYYAFDVAGVRSPIGRTRTLGDSGTSRVRLGVASCSNYPFGYFNAYAALAARADLDAVVHLGDYIYEYQNGKYGDGTKFGRVPSPDKEIVALADYRGRHAQYKSDPDLQEVHRQHPFIVIWDDHELANNTWMDGAENHHPDQGEGDWPTRRAAAVQAYLEWMPIREEARTLSTRIYRTLRFGGLVDLVLLDTRLAGRTEQPGRDDVAAMESADRTLLGAAQEHWLHGELAESRRAGTTWQILGQQVLFAPQAPPGKPSRATDTWDGYRASRDRVFDMIEGLKLDSVAVLTGDIHSSWAYDLPRRPYDNFDPTTGRGSLGVEFAGTSVTSPSSLGSGPDGEKQLADLKAARPHLHYVDGRYRGYYIVDITRERLQADYFAVDTIEKRSKAERFVTGYAAPRGQMCLSLQQSPASAKSDAPDPAP